MRPDTLAESATHDERVIGRSSRAGLHLLSDATQFVITEPPV